MAGEISYDRWLANTSRVRTALLTEQERNITEYYREHKSVGMTADAFGCSEESITTVLLKSLSYGERKYMKYVPGGDNKGLASFCVDYVNEIHPGALTKAKKPRQIMLSCGTFPKWAVKEHGFDELIYDLLCCAEEFRNSPLNDIDTRMIADITGYREKDIRHMVSMIRQKESHYRARSLLTECHEKELMFENVTITSEIRQDVREHLIPAAIEFIRAIGGYYFMEDIDCLDRVCVEGRIRDLFYTGVFKLTCISGAGKANIEYSFLTGKVNGLQEQIEGVLAGPDGDDMYLRSSMFTPDESDSVEYSMVRWDLGLNFRADEGGILSKTFIDAYEKLRDAAEACYEFSEAHEITDLGFAVLHDTVRGSETYELKVSDGMTAETGKYRSRGHDITSTEVLVERRFADKAPVFIYTETLLELDEECLDEKDFEYRQTFRIGEPEGIARSILCGNDVIARLYCIRPGVYVMKPLDLYLMDEPGRFGRKNGEYLIVTRDRNESFSFFTDTGRSGNGRKSGFSIGRYRRIAYTGPDPELTVPEEKGHRKVKSDYIVSIDCRYKPMLPLVAAIKEWVFVPDGGKVSEFAADREERRFSLLNIYTQMLILTVSAWMSGEDRSLAYEFLSDPAARVLKLLSQYRPDLLKAYNDGNDTGLIEDICFVQSTKDRCYGVTSDTDAQEIIRKKNSLKQITIGDFLIE